ncbi:Uma2 family endonuclease [Haloferula sp.]|uniref:Uma2 family endonuclease n=1 Tax=Haloferula sp. TaxID=2497595 RepID=UPI003C7459FD
MSTVLEAAEISATGADRTAFNLAVWDKIIADPEFAAMPYRFETDEHGQIIMSPPASPDHSDKQFKIASAISRMAPTGKVLPECPISTVGGVKAADVAWCSPEIWLASKGKSCLVRAPEICVEILSPSNTDSEIEEKKQLYFEAGAREFWLCSVDGEMSFFSSEGPIPTSRLCPDFPDQIS